jgi:hypothetical protein
VTDPTQNGRPEDRGADLSYSLTALDTGHSRPNGRKPSRLRGDVATRRAYADDHLFIYLSGSIRKGRQDNRQSGSFWSEDEERRVAQGIEGANVHTLNPAKSDIRRSDYIANFGCDLHLVNISDVVLVDARTRKGIGIGAEMMFARFEGIPVITICPRNSNYRRDFVADVFGEDLHDWVHPFIAGLSDHIVESLDEAIALLNKLWSSGRLRQSNPTVYEAIDYYNRQREALMRSSAQQPSLSG